MPKVSQPTRTRKASSAPADPALARRRDVAVWLLGVRRQIGEIYDSLSRVVAEVHQHPDGELASLLGDDADQLAGVLSEIENAETKMYAVRGPELPALPDIIGRAAAAD